MPRIIACKLKQKKGGWYEVAKIGKWKGHLNGKFELSLNDLKQILQNFKNQGLDIVVDYEHQTLSGDKAPASGWIKHPKGLKVEENTLYAKIVWTKEAKKSIKNKEYRYLSPVLLQNAKDGKSGKDIGWALHSVALTNTPFFKELEPIAAKQNQKKGDTVAKEESVDVLKAEIKKLKKQIKTLQKENQKLKTISAKEQVQKLIAAKKITKEQEAWAFEYAIKDPQGFAKFAKKAKVKVVAPKSNQFAASSKPGKDLDVVKLAAGESDE